MKVLLTFSMFFSAATAMGSDSDMLIYMLSSENVKSQLEDRDIQNISFSKENVSTSWTYTAKIRTIEDGLGPNGPDKHPCFTNVEVVTIGGIAGTQTSEPLATTDCAMNAPIVPGN